MRVIYLKLSSVSLNFKGTEYRKIQSIVSVESKTQIRTKSKSKDPTIVRLEYSGQDFNQLVGKVYSKKGIHDTIPTQGVRGEEYKRLINFLSL